MSLDQLAAEQVGAATRYPSIPLAMTSEGGKTLSYTRSGAPIPDDRLEADPAAELTVEESRDS